MKNIYLTILSLTLCCFQGVLFAESGGEIQSGVVIDEVTCNKQPDQSYALFLPSSYSPERRWPVLYAFDPGARGRIPLERFKEAADHYHYIVVGSNNARNGPMEPIVQAARAVWVDSQTRFAIDATRVYVTGFSGGARVASVFPRIIGRPIAGIIGCGAGLSTGLDPQQVKPACYYGIVGIEDLNYLEMMVLDKQFDGEDVLHRILVFDGTHDWPPPSICTRAIEWMEVMGMKRKIRPWDENLIAEFYNEELEAARGLEESGEIFRAVSDYEATVSTFDHWQDMSNVAAKAQQLKQSQDYRQFLKKEKRRSRRESSKLNKFSEVYSQIERSSLSLMDLRKILSKTGIQSLIKEVRTGKNINDRRVAIRLLQSLTINSQSQGWKNLKKKEYRKAIFFYEIASRASKLRDYGRRGFIFYNLACAYALDKNKHQALENLELAVENGFDELAILERDEDLDSIRNTSEFRGIIQKLKH